MTMKRVASGMAALFVMLAAGATAAAPLDPFKMWKDTPKDSMAIESEAEAKQRFEGAPAPAKRERLCEDLQTSLDMARGRPVTVQDVARLLLGAQTCPKLLERLAEGL